ncbi:MAG: hypothetical protein KC464_10295, partial [Myxococcales bacterium]|nr:hypothetical protein [Myxococcales bacterium]
DAAPPALCYTMSDTDCGYTPEPVTPADVSLADQQALAVRFNPAMVYTGDAVWAVSFDMLLVHGAPLQRAEHDGRLNFSYKVDETTTENVFATQPADLRTVDLTGQPTTAQSGRGYVYFLNFPGTNEGNEYAQQSWKAEWTNIQGNDPTAAPFPPFQYAHLFWLDKAQRLLAIQYFFYYPYDKFTNAHEGDWEHINVILRYPETGAASLAMAHFSYHGRQLGIPAENLYRVGDGGNGDHVVAFIGGDGCLNYVDSCWCGDTSGASYPYPGLYDLGYWEEVAGGASRPGRAVHAEDFTVQLLPRVEDIDFTAEPQLSWYALPFIAGQPTTPANHAAVIATNNHRAPVGPGPEHDEFEVGIEETDPALEQGAATPFVVPGTWTMLNEPPSSVFGTLPTNDNCSNP